MTLSSNEIQKILPHRWPFLMIDKVTECEPGQYADAVKCVSANEMQFCGHFPEYHVMPGVLILEALAQTGAVALLTEADQKGKLVFFGRQSHHLSAVNPGPYHRSRHIWDRSLTFSSKLLAVLTEHEPGFC